MEYIDHFEIESRRPGERWEHVGNCYPEYQWRIWRPWYFLWLRRRIAILNERVAWTSLFEKLCREIPKDSRIVIWYREGNKVVREGRMKPC